MIKVCHKQCKLNKVRHFSWDIFKSDTISFFIKIYSSISITFKIKFSRFMTTVIQTMEMNQNQTFPMRHIQI